MIAVGRPVENVSLRIIDRLARFCLVAVVGEDFAVWLGPAEEPCCCVWEVGEVERGEEEGRGYHGEDGAGATRC